MSWSVLIFSVMTLGTLVSFYNHSFKAMNAGVRMLYVAYITIDMAMYKVYEIQFYFCNCLNFPAFWERRNGLCILSHLESHFSSSTSDLKLCIGLLVKQMVSNYFKRPHHLHTLMLRACTKITHNQPLGRIFFWHHSIQIIRLTTSDLIVDTDKRS